MDIATPYTPGAQIAVIRGEVEHAAEAMISAAGHGLRLVKEARDGVPGALDALEETFCAILEACAFQDLTGQRLARLMAGLAGVNLSAPGGDPLLNGPADPGEGLDQAAADRLFG